MRKIVQKFYGPDENGNVYEYFEAFADSSEAEKYPTEFIADGSSIIETDSGNWKFFNEKTKAWKLMLNIEE